MHLYDWPLIFVLVGLIFYTVLGGADFGAGMWQLTAGRGPEGERIRDYAHHSMAPVWEANHVWLIFVLTVTWTSYPVAFGSIASTLSIPLFLAALGLILRGAAYALRSGARTPLETRRTDTVFAVSSLLTPFALGTCIGAIACRRVPVGNAAGHLFSSWLNGTSVMIGVLAVLSSAYLAAVYLSADAARQGDPELVRAFRSRALTAGVLAGAAAVAGVIVIHGNAPLLYHGLTHGGGLVALLVSFAAGIAALSLVRLGRFEPARYVAALAVAAVIAGWALAQEPTFLPHLTVARAAAPRDTLVLVVVSVLAGALILFPSLALLFRLFLGGHLGGTPGAADQGQPLVPDAFRPLREARSTNARVAVAAFLAGLILLVFADAWWAQAIGVICLFACVVVGFAAVGPADMA
ncbi:MAG: cytochrome d ubiquinol oxidase subunit II [Solirubrobacteraceae bacterium]